jgi:hypothetical protein
VTLPGGKGGRRRLKCHRRVGQRHRVPDGAIDLIEGGGPPYAELFSRRARFGWDYPIGAGSVAA